LLDVTMPARERLFHCAQFSLWRVRTGDPFTVGAAGVPRVLVCIDGAGHVEHGGSVHAARRGDVVLLPAVLGACVFRPAGEVTLLEIELPESAASAGAPKGHGR
jgi:mannose-6-phosphate isomerase